MIVQELITHLQKLPPTAKVVTDGYEGGYDDVGQPRMCKFHLDKSAEWYLGKYDSGGKINACYIPRLSKPF